MRTLDDIVPPSRRKAEAPRESGPEPLRPRAPRARFPYVTALIAAVVVIGAGLLLYYFSTASVEVTPNASTVTATGTYSATATGDLPFKVVTADKVATQSVQSTGTKNVSSVAQGTITISNSQSKAQKLIANTRFESANGLIYRIHNAVSVPASGSVQAVAYADQPGASYNVAAATFTLPGLKGSPSFTQVTAKTTGISGGASGAQPTVDTAVESTTRTALKTALAGDLKSALLAQVPDGYVLINGGSQTTYQDLTPTASPTTGMVDIKEEGVATAVVFPKAALARAIALQAQGANYSGEPLTVTNPADLTLTPVSGLPAADDQSFGFSLSGNADMVSTIDPTRIASAIAGKTRAAAEVALTNYPEVKQAVLVLRPFWRGEFPQDPASIKVVVDAPN